MKYTVILSFFVLAGALFSLASSLHAQDAEPATHLWLYSNTSTVYVPAATKQGCKTLVSQASMLNSSTGHCYFKEQFLEEIKCNKSTQKGGVPSCTTNSTSTR